MKQPLYAALYNILRPLIRILFRKGVACGEMVQVLKRVYVDVVETELARTEGKATTSRIAVVTGLTRKDVAGLRKVEKAGPGPSERYNRVVRVVSGWLGDAEFLDAAGRPRALSPGPGGGFERLVGRFSGDMPPRSVLDELVRVGAAQVMDDGRLRLRTAAYLAGGDEEESLSILGTDVAHLVGTIDHNLAAAEADRRFQRKVAYDNLPVEHIAEFRRLAARENQKLLLKLNAWLARHDRDATPGLEGTGRLRAGVGIYYFEEAVAGGDAQEDEAQ